MALKHVILYETSDGNQFDNEIDANGHEEYLASRPAIEAYIAAAGVQRAHATYLRKHLPAFTAYARSFDPATYNAEGGEGEGEELDAVAEGEMGAESAQAVESAEAGQPADSGAAAEVEPAKRGGKRTSVKEYAGA